MRNNGMQVSERRHSVSVPRPSHGNAAVEVAFRSVSASLNEYDPHHQDSAHLQAKEGNGGKIDFQK